MTRLLTTCFALLLSLSVFSQIQSETSLITFGLDEDHLSAFAKTQLAKIAEEAMAADVYSVALYGHTDQQGDAQYNSDLARRRATSV
ncbi:MAG: OmpA family protein [Saprospiraceae bacterium]